NFSPELKTWHCPWCGHQHEPPHTNDQQFVSTRH
ncbi:uncharacterized protein METZ01_LOCUS344925, partial [marine metagenome]